MIFNFSSSDLLLPLLLAYTLLYLFTSYYFSSPSSGFHLFHLFHHLLLVLGLFVLDVLDELLELRASCVFSSCIDQTIYHIPNEMTLFMYIHLCIRQYMPSIPKH